MIHPDEGYRESVCCAWANHSAILLAGSTCVVCVQHKVGKRAIEGRGERGRDLGFLCSAEMPHQVASKQSEDHQAHSSLQIYIHKKQVYTPHSSATNRTRRHPYCCR